MSFGILYPTGHVVALLPGDGTAWRAKAALLADGFAEDEIMEFSGLEFVALVEAHRENETMWSQFVEQVSRTLGTEMAYLDHDLELAREGAAVLAVRVKDVDAVKRARKILESANALAMRHYGALMIEVFREHPQVATSAQQDSA